MMAWMEVRTKAWAWGVGVGCEVWGVGVGRA